MLVNFFPRNKRRETLKCVALWGDSAGPGTLPSGQHRQPWGSGRRGEVLPSHFNLQPWGT